VLPSREFNGMIPESLVWYGTVWFNVPLDTL